MTIAALAEIGLKAVEVQRLAAVRCKARTALRDAFRAWKEEHGHDHITRDSAEWEEVTAATEDLYSQSRRAQREEAAARRRLATACRRVMAAETQQ